MYRGRRLRLVRGFPSALCALWVCSTLVSAQQGVSTFERLTVGASAVGITSTTTNPSGRSQMNTCEIKVEGAGVYARDDGTDPTATTGWPLADSATMSVPSNAIARGLRFISSSGATLVNVRCYP